VLELESALRLWQDGERRLRDLDPPSARGPVERVVTQLVAELRRRLGSRFTAQELADLYDTSHQWTMGLAVRIAPGEPIAWEQWVVDAAFNRYLRDAADWPRPVPPRRGAVPPRPPAGAPPGAPGGSRPREG
jgi:hypothetical protein